MWAWKSIVSKVLLTQRPKHTTKSYKITQELAPNLITTDSLSDTHLSQPSTSSSPPPSIKMSQVETLTATQVPTGAAAANDFEAAERKRAEDAAAVDAAIATATAALQAASLAPPAEAAKSVPNGVSAPAKVAPAPARGPAPVDTPALPPASAAPKFAAYGATDVSVIPDEPLEKWLRTHHKEETGEFLSVVQERSGANIDWAWGPFVLKLVISFTGVTGEFGINIPFFGYKKLIDINGDLIQGVGAGFDIGIASGSIKLYLKGRQVFFEIHAQAFGAKWDKTVVLITL
ncbi:hypothetical protein BOTBODRAFT_455264 [Botryobasidium botryosum FD-172 SS1]|uniref:Uncharacterized protein n=1 Tax=Botryobasidium botryosum (strain FD-172 SS1) TaxID=930990 RepID=A0A067MHS6_BOTB1|nr:hypothetical protein BOTBODRAFT_455264 [Botryobasidium botryosum FD-172 SS1]